MEILAALIAVTAFIWSIVALVAAIFPGNRKLRLKHSGAAFLIFLGLAIFGPRTSPEELKARATLANQDAAVAPPETAPPEARAASEDAGPTATAAPASPRPDPLLQRQEREAADYADLVAAETAIVKAFNAREFTKDAQTILIAVEVLNAFARTYADGSKFGLSSEQQAARSAFKRAVSQKQQQALPLLRDAYGPAMRRALWEVDGEARTIGTGFRTIELVNGAFAANRNIKKTQDDMRLTFMKLRFTRAQYKWFARASEYQYYTMSPPSDGDLVIWDRNGNFTKLD